MPARVICSEARLLGRSLHCVAADASSLLRQRHDGLPPGAVDHCCELPLKSCWTARALPSCVAAALASTVGRVRLMWPVSCRQPPRSGRGSRRRWHMQTAPWRVSRRGYVSADCAPAGKSWRRLARAAAQNQTGAEHERKGGNGGGGPPLGNRRLISI